MLQKATLYLTIGLVTLALAASAGSVAAQQPLAEDQDWCRDRDRDRDHDRYCEVREFTLGAMDRIVVDAEPNGGITVEGWDRNEIRVLARVSGQADGMDAARALVREVEVLTGGTISSDGPRSERHEWWSVSFRIFAPRNSDLSLETTNGGIRINDVAGDIEFHTTNGGVHLTGVAGDVRGRTTNGGLHVDLTGSEWQGSGLDVRTTNGGVKLTIPDGYNARLETGTTNGGMRFDFPVTVQGRIDRRLSVDLGGGGKLIRAFTTNGGVTVVRG
jgi:hypothetical protein